MGQKCLSTSMLHKDMRKKEGVFKPGPHQNQVLAGLDVKQEQGRLHPRVAGRRKFP